MMNELECALIERRWGHAAFLLENGDDVIGEGMAREALAALLRENEKNPRGKPRKIAPDDQSNLEEMLVVTELNALVDGGMQKEAAKLHVCGNHPGLTRSMVEQIDKKYRENFSGLIK